jgi:hypothetical protein
LRDVLKVFFVLPRGSLDFGTTAYEEDGPGGLSHKSGSGGTRADQGVRPTVRRTGRYGIGTDIELETPTLLVAVMLNDCSMWTRSLALLPLDKTKGIAIRNAPPKGVDAVL